MSLTALQSLATHVAQITGIKDWYDYYFAAVTDDAEPSPSIENRFFSYTDASTNGNTPFFLFRGNGGGPSDMHLKRTMATITLVHNPSYVVVGDELMAKICRLLRTDATQDGVVRFDPQGGVVGPDYMDNGRPVWSLSVDIYT